MNKNIHYRTVGLILAVYLTLLVGTIRSENTPPFPKPTLTTVLNGTWAQDVEDYIGDRMGFHDALFRLKSNTDLLVGEKLIQDVYITDDMLLEKLTASGEDDLTAASEKVNQFYEEYQLPTYLVLVPSASAIYEEQLPTNAVMMDQEAAIKSVYGMINSYVRCIDAFSILSSVTDSYVYYRTDSRWTSYGAYCVYQTAIQKMGFTAMPYYRYVISHMSTDFRGDLYERTLYDGIKADVLDCYTCENGSEITSVTAWYGDGRTEDRGSQLYDTDVLSSQENMYQFYLGPPCEKLVIRTDLKNDKKLLLYKDSYADCMVPFLTQHYSEICILDLDSTKEDLAMYAEPSDYTHVLFLAGMENWRTIWAAK